MLPILSVVHKAWHDRNESRAADRAEALRPILTRFALTDDVVEGSEILERVSYDELVAGAGRLLTKLRGADRERLANALAQEGVIARAMRDTRSWRRSRRAIAAHLLGAAAVPAAMPDLVRLTQDRSEEVRRVAARGLGRMSDGRGVRALISALEEPRVLSQGTVGLSMVRMGPAAAPTLRDALSSEDMSVRGVAADVLGHLGDTEAVSGLIGLLGDDEPTVRMAAAAALRRIGSPQARDPLARTAVADHEPAVRAAAVNALTALGPRHSLETLRTALTDVDHRVIRLAATGLAQAGEEGVRELQRTEELGGAASRESREALEEVAA